MHSPDGHLTLRDFVDTPTDDNEAQLSISSRSQTTTTPFSPYPNLNSFLLGEWFWDNGIQKSQRDFKDLLDILCHPDFELEDIRKTNWSNINTTLSQSGGTGDSEAEWMDEGWKCSPITIQVPFHRLTENPGSRPYLVGQFHHRSLVAVIKEQLKSADAGTRFHFEPHELLWKRGNGLQDIRVYGEMYTSDKLLEMHRNLLESPPVPGCNAPRAIVPLMFWSDSTHLTSFGQAKLWPLYMFFGSDSKYRRCKPSANLCSHMAYFQKVRLSFLSLLQDWADHGHNSCQMLSVILSQLGGRKGKSHQMLYWHTATGKHFTPNGKLYLTMNSSTLGKMEYLCPLIRSSGGFIPE